MRFINLARHVAAWSKDPSTKVGAVIVRPDRTVASVGYNGLPRGVLDTPARLDDREVKYLMTVHAEANAILSAHEPVKGYTLYVAPLHPCANCAALIIQAGIARVVALMDAPSDRWQVNFRTSGRMLNEAGIQTTIFPELTP